LEKLKEKFKIEINKLIEKVKINNEEKEDLNNQIFNLKNNNCSLNDELADLREKNKYPFRNSEKIEKEVDDINLKVKSEMEVKIKEKEENTKILLNQISSLESDLEYFRNKGTDSDNSKFFEIIDKLKKENENFLLEKKKYELEIDEFNIKIMSLQKENNDLKEKLTDINMYNSDNNNNNNNNNNDDDDDDDDEFLKNNILNNNKILLEKNLEKNVKLFEVEKILKKSLACIVLLLERDDRLIKEKEEKVGEVYQHFQGKLEEEIENSKRNKDRFEEERIVYVDKINQLEQEYERLTEMICEMIIIGKSKEKNQGKKNVVINEQVLHSNDLNILKNNKCYQNGLISSSGSNFVNRKPRIIKNKAQEYVASSVRPLIFGNRRADTMQMEDSDSLVEESDTLIKNVDFLINQENESFETRYNQLLNRTKVLLNKYKELSSLYHNSLLKLKAEDNIRDSPSQQSCFLNHKSKYNKSIFEALHSPMNFSSPSHYENGNKNEDNYEIIRKLIYLIESEKKEKENDYLSDYEKILNSNVELINFINKKRKSSEVESRKMINNNIFLPDNNTNNTLNSCNNNYDDNFNSCLDNYEEKSEYERKNYFNKINEYLSNYIEVSNFIDKTLESLFPYTQSSQSLDLFPSTEFLKNLFDFSSSQNYSSSIHHSDLSYLLSNTNLENKSFINSEFFFNPLSKGSEIKIQSNKLYNPKPLQLNYEKLQNEIFDYEKPNNQYLNLQNSIKSNNKLEFSEFMI
jgi:hypothetical protein